MNSFKVFIALKDGKYLEVEENMIKLNREQYFSCLSNSLITESFINVGHLFICVDEIQSIQVFSTGGTVENDNL
ncbi:hypothetical protein [Bacillus thuringiensis]|uniref:Uncharacterized protein n=1 Tax=Bacillus thuringiensis HD-771 TaxID=1218175 RepID=A0A9W3P1E8_BACTU|nr:hypothetical protein [Bacillus thuringiensis]AFQ20014.1 hypothetical protein BTG_33423 [Bacillus thuringiensis HD-771]MEC3460794.1 hypothetical protein [Bacillus thuringiensis]MEC3514454.1 hypothetical protein [Bacillus thuringiensis]MEC3540154.1 hypothetical protein [Bacillus thuringiensis]